MSKRVERVHKITALLGCLFVLGTCFFTSAALAARQSSAGAAPRVLVLPFQVHDGAGQAAAQTDFPNMLGEQLASKGVAVVPNDEMMRLIKSRNISSLDLSAVRSLLATSGATHAVYGSINQIGGSMSVDARLVGKGSGSARPLFVEQRQGAANVTQLMDSLSTEVNAALPRPKDSMNASGSTSASGTVAGIEVRGTKYLEPDVVLMRITTRKGDTPDAQTIDQEVQRIWDLGYFHDVQVNIENRREGLYLVYTVVEKPRVESVSVEGSDEIDEDDIIAVMGNKAGSILNESLLAEDIQKILELYRKKGFYLAKVDQRTDSRQGGSSAALVIMINEGKKLYIKDVRLEGAEQLPASDVKKELLLTERGLFSWISGSGVLKEELIERDSAAIATYYLDRGFMDVTVAAAKIDYEDDGIAITFPVIEGPKYTLSNISFGGDLIESDDKLRSVITMDEKAQNGEVFQLSAMQADARKLTDLYADYGYAFADVNPRPRKHPDGSNLVDIEFFVEKKSKIYIRRAMVEGNSKTRDNVILRELRLTDGEQFEGGKLRRSTERLDKLGYFEVAEAELVPTENEDEVDLKVKVKERPTGAVMAGVGYSTFSQVGVSATIMERNLWGKGYNLSLQAGFSGRRDAFTLSFTNPRYQDTDLAIGIDAYHWRDDYIDYRKQTTGAVARFSYPIGEYTSIGWGYRLDQYKIYDLNDNASSLLRKYAHETRHTSSALGRIVRDSTDKLRPTSGNIDILAIEYGGGLIGGDDDFISLSVEHQTYYQLVPNHILHGRIKASTLLKNGSDDVPVFERFWMGGMDSVRGYNSRDLVPRDKKSGDRIGGDRMAFANLEYIWSIDNEIGINLVPFFDIGFNLDSDDYTWSDEIKKSVGVEARWRSPMGDLRFSYGIPLDEDRRGNKDSGRFEFSMGQFF